MNELIKTLTDDMRSNNLKIDNKHYRDIVSYSDSYTEEDAFPKLVATAIHYLIEIEKRNCIIKDLKQKLKHYEKEYSVLAHMKQVPYAEDMKQRKKNGIYPAEKHISCESVKKLDDMGLSKQEIMAELEISRSTVYRKLREAETKGYSAEVEVHKRLNF